MKTTTVNTRAITSKMRPSRPRPNRSGIIAANIVERGAFASNLALQWGQTNSAHPGRLNMLGVAIFRLQLGHIAIHPIVKWQFHDVNVTKENECDQLRRGFSAGDT